MNYYKNIEKLMLWKDASFILFLFHIKYDNMEKKNF